MNTLYVCVSACMHCVFFISPPSNILWPSFHVHIIGNDHFLWVVRFLVTFIVSFLTLLRFLIFLQ